MVGKPRRISERYAAYSTPEAILLAAEELCGEQGVAGLKLREIARRVGIEPASVYNHFRGLDGVLAGVVERSLEAQIALLDLPEELQGEAAIREMCLRSARYFTARKGVARLMLLDMAEVPNIKKGAFDVNEAGIVEMLDREAALLRRHLGLGHLGRPRLGQIATARAFMTISLLAQRWLNDWETGDTEAISIAELVSAFMLGLPGQVQAEED